MTNEIRAAIRPVKVRIEDDLIARQGVNAVDIAEKISNGKPTGELSIVVYVDKKVPLAKLSKAAAIPAEIDGIPTDVQEMSIELQPAWERLDASAMVDATAYPTLAGGISIGPAKTFYLTPPDVPTAGNYTMVGTLGALVRDTATGATMALTNFHVAAVNTAWSASDRLCQPGRPDGGVTPGGDFGTLARAVLSDHVDGAVVRLDAGKAWNASVTGIGAVNGTATATVGMAVRKRGRTTELTYGTVASVDFTVSVPYGDGLGTRTLRNQIRITTNTTRSTRFSDHGDSGSVIVDDNINVVGLLFAGSTDGSETFANPIATALSELGVTMLTGNPVLPVVTRGVACAPTVLTCPSVVACPTIGVVCRTKQTTCLTNVTLCKPSRLIVCPTTPVTCLRTSPVLCRISTLACPSQGVSCLTRGACPTVAVCGDPGRPGEQQQADYGYGGDDASAGAYEAGYAEGYAAASGASEQEQVDPSFWAGYLAALEQAGGEDAQQ